MNRVLALVEGKTEQLFIRQVLAPYLAPTGCYITARIAGDPGHKGGNARWRRVERDLLGLAKQDRLSDLTTMFDLYALPGDWPGQSEVREKRLKGEAAAIHIESAIHASLTEKLDGYNGARFVPHIQLHEFEALLFSDPDQLAQQTGRGHAVAPHAEQYERIVHECGSCEQIDGSFDTAPSRRIKAIAPGYDKIVDGLRVAQRIGIDRMRERCPHFDDWIRRLLALAH